MTIRARFHVRRGDFLLDVDLQFAGRGVTGLFGPSGSGKTTILRAVAGLERFPGGLLGFGDATWQNANQFVPPHHRRVGYVFQEASLFTHLSIRRNLEYGFRRTSPSERKIALEQAVELLGIGRLVDRKPETLSGGERQRVAIARALASSPRLLLLDEPLAALDLAARREILPYLESLHDELKIPVIYVSHSIEEVARLADSLVILEDGRVVSSGETNHLLTRLDLRHTYADEAASVITTQVSRIDETYHLSLVDFEGHTLAVTGALLRPGYPVRLRIAARDVSLTLRRQSGTSILNIFPAVVDELRAEGDAQVLVRLLIGNSAILSRITRKSSAELDLIPGKQVYAQVKSVALLD